MGTKPRLTMQTLKVLGTLITHNPNGLSGAEIGRAAKLHSGTLYPILLRLEQAGWLESRWESETPQELGRPRRRFYQLTGLGARNAKSAFRDVTSTIGGGMARALVLAVGGFIIAVLTRLFGDELKAWMPWFTKRLLRIALERLPECQRERFSEEWASHIDEVPGEIGKIVVAVGCVSAAQQMASLSNNCEAALTRYFKRFLDVAASAIILFIIAPLFLCIPLLVRVLDGAGPAFSREGRVGLNGKRFLMYRFRLGTVDAHEVVNGQSQKKKRLSFLGYFLRLTSIDELPQLINVLRGDITLVGPRAALVRPPESLPPQ